MLASITVAKENLLIKSGDSLDNFNEYLHIPVSILRGKLSWQIPHKRESAQSKIQYDV
jgi:hypothetical protein